MSSSENFIKIDTLVASLRKKLPDYLVGKAWYSRNEIINNLKSMNYSDQIAQELTNYFLLHIRHAFNRGVFSGIKAHVEHGNDESIGQASSQSLSKETVDKLHKALQVSGFKVPEISQGLNSDIDMYVNLVASRLIQKQLMEVQ